MVYLRVVAHPPDWAYGYSSDWERQAACLAAWAKELNEFVRDHRSQDAVCLRVEREVKQCCSGCDEQWEELDGCCAWCGRPVEVGPAEAGGGEEGRNV